VANVVKSIVTPVFEASVTLFGKLKKVITDNKDNFESFFDFVKAAAPVIGKVLGAAVGIIGDVATIVLDIIAKVLGAIKPLINTAIDGINKVITGINLIKPGSDIKYLSKIGEGSTSTGPLGNFSMSTGGVSTSATTGTTGGTTGAATTGGATIGGVTTGGGASGTATNAITTVAKKATQVVTDIAGAFDNFTSGTTTLAGIMAQSNQAFAFGTSGVNTNTLAGIMAASNQPKIEIVVNAPSIIDEEGFKRAATDAFNNSYYRGTGGAGNLVAV
jgi:hypothetical protein